MSRKDRPPTWHAFVEDLRTELKAVVDLLEGIAFTSARDWNFRVAQELMETLRCLAEARGGTNRVPQNSYCTVHPGQKLRRKGQASYVCDVCAVCLKCAGKGCDFCRGMGKVE